MPFLILVVVLDSEFPGAGGKFCGGFDINVFTKVHQTGNGMPSTLCCCLDHSTLLAYRKLFLSLTWATLVAGDVSLMPDVSVELVSNMMEGMDFATFLCIPLSFCIYSWYHYCWSHLFCRGQKTFCCSHSRPCSGWRPRIDYGMPFY